ncbi:7750_t:CDS:2 [Racocetra persica]|uniref:7750_t:CDS:1 n=1 Tax=Racocetra persica TaxID=160502 RepID=A0ACA9N737_9GLOM|nr:7750_t:CDS:2 [Racocetra persica]
MRTRKLEKSKLQVYHRTYVFEDFSKSFEDLLIIDRYPSANRSNNSYPLSPSSSVKGLSVNKDDINTLNNNQDEKFFNIEKPERALSSFCLRSSSALLKVIELEDFSKSEEQNLIEDKGFNDISSSTLMSFDYSDQFRTKK